MRIYYTANGRIFHEGITGRHEIPNALLDDTVFRFDHAKPTEADLLRKENALLLEERDDLATNNSRHFNAWQDAQSRLNTLREENARLKRELADAQRLADLGWQRAWELAKK